MRALQPATFRVRYGDRLVTPRLMPPANVDLDLLPASWGKAAKGEIDVEGYHQPIVEVEYKPRSNLTPEERARRAERLAQFQKRRADRKQPA